MRSTVGSVAFDMVKSHVNNFAENTKALVKVLDEVAKVHPFIQSVSPLVSTLCMITNSSWRSCSFCVQDGD